MPIEATGESASETASEARPPGVLSVVATPIGNLEDLTLRALRVLREADRILAEDTRRSRLLLRHHGIDRPLRAFHAHSGEGAIRQAIEEIRGGARIALVSDAGTPVVSDPGARLVAAAHDAGLRVEPIPGASAPLAAVVACGLRGHGFRFLGFLPKSGRRRAERIESVRSSEELSLLFESPARLPATLAELAERLGPERRAAVCRELTKLHEEIARGGLGELAARYAEPPKGEITLVIEGASLEEAEAREEIGDEEIRAWLEEEGLRVKEASKRLAQQSALSGAEAYKRVLAVREGSGERGGEGPGEA